ncbi:hypothetical protein ACKI2N_002410 [Cupriavidus sp. 30B13]|uniref:hypothetical protein n=1 Tax=Cupriavidus sp. 30B13 TaxID=3384241 RepID=UPI003B8ED8C8
MTRLNQSHPLKRQRGAVALFPRPRFDGPLARELHAGLARIGAEIRRTAALVNIRRKLRAIDREERRATSEVAYLRDELLQQERNLAWLAIEHKASRDQLNRQYEKHLAQESR